VEEAKIERNESLLNRIEQKELSYFKKHKNETKLSPSNKNKHNKNKEPSNK